MDKHYQYEKDELSVGMEVATEHSVHYLWSRHRLWKIRKISALTPKKTRVTFEDGTSRDFKRVYGKYYTGVFKPDEEMERVNAVTNAFLLVKEVTEFFRNSNNIESMDDDTLLRTAEVLKNLEGIIGGVKNETK